MSTSENTSESTTKSALQDNIESKGKNAYYFAHAHKTNGPKWDGKPQPRLLSTHSSSMISNNEEEICNNNDNNSTRDTNSTSLEEETDGLKISSLNTHARSLIQSLKDNKSSFDFAKSNITKYAFLDDGKKIKIYIDMKGVGDVCNADEDVNLDWDERSFSLKIHNYKAPVEDENTNSTSGDDGKEVQCLSFGRLHGPITKASVKVKQDRMILTLFKKVEEGEDPEEWPAIARKGESEHEVV